MIARTVLAVLALAAGTTAAHAQRRPADAEADPARVVALLAALAHDSMEGRDTGSRGSAAAARLIAA